MQQIEGLRGRLSTGGPWLRVGIASATAMAPLVNRWNELRAAERARNLADEAEARLRELRGLGGARNEALNIVRQVTAQVPERRGKVSSKIWLIGVGVGLVAAGTATFILVRRRMAQSLDEPLLDLITVSSMNGRGPAAANGSSTAAKTPAEMPAQATAGQGTPPAEQDQREPDELFGGATTLTPTEAPAGEMDAEAAPFIGNIRTMIYHEADDANLPAEENRIYFASEEEAQEAGYRRDRDEVIPGAQSGEAASS